MTTTFVTASVKGEKSVNAGVNVAKIAQKKMSDVQPDFAILFSSTEYDYTEVLKGVRSVVGEIPLVGCSSAGEFTEEAVTTGGIVLALIASDNHKFMSGFSEKLKEGELQSIERAAKRFPSYVEGYPHNSMIFLMDGLAFKGEEAVTAATTLLGPNVKLAGAAAGDDMRFKETKVFCDQDSCTNGVSLGHIASKEPMSISVKHGHLPLSKALHVTKAEKNVLYEIDGRPALSVWKEVLLNEGLGIEEKDFSTPETLGKILLKYEAGILIGNEYKLRYPVSTNPDGSINFLCTIPEGALLKIMKSSEKEEIKSAKLAAEEALKNAKNKPIAGAIVFDCVCRAALLGEQYPKAVQEIKKVLGDIPIIGIDTYGEIAMELGQLSGFHNTTTVILLIPN